MILLWSDVRPERSVLQKVDVSPVPTGSRHPWAKTRQVNAEKKEKLPRNLEKLGLVQISGCC
jgi:hypothetical protein